MLRYADTVRDLRNKVPSAPRNEAEGSVGVGIIVEKPRKKQEIKMSNFRNNVLELSGLKDYEERKEECLEANGAYKAWEIENPFWSFRLQRGYREKLSLILTKLSEDERRPLNFRESSRDFLMTYGEYRAVHRLHVILMNKGVLPAPLRVFDKRVLEI